MPDIHKTKVQHGTHDHSHCIETALREAEIVCVARGVRLTDLRKRVLELVWQSHKAVKAYDLLAALGSDAKPPTVYRALDFLMEQGLVHKLHSLNAYIGCPSPGHGQSGRFLICTSCDSVAEFQSQDLNTAVFAASKDADFELDGQMIELSGLCKLCRDNKKQEG